MKKMMLALAMILTIGTSTTFAREENVSKQVLRSFNNEFATAEEVSWTVGSNYYKAAFSLNGQKVFAYYSHEGKLLGVARYISSLQLPLQLLTELKTGHSNYWISDLFEVSNEDGTSYYVTLENADSVVMLKSGSDNAWDEYSKKRKS
jgi:hypothetical protein